MQIVITGNFRISKVALNELVAWGKPSLLHPFERKKWQEVQEIIKIIKERWPQNIETVSAGELFDQLTLLEPLLSKTITFNLVMGQFDEIYRAISQGKVSINVFIRKLEDKIRVLALKTFEKEYERLKSIFIIRNKKEYEEIAAHNIMVTLERILRFIEHLACEARFSLESAKARVGNEFRNKVENDKRIVEHFLLSSLRKKHFPAEDKDTVELIMLHRNMVFV